VSLPAGKLNKRIRIEKRVNTKDALNQPVETWVLVCITWAQALGETGIGTIRNSLQVGGVSRQISQYSWRIRYKTFNTFKNDMRVNWNGVFFDILQINHDMDKNEWTDLICEQGGNDG